MHARTVTEKLFKHISLALEFFQPRLGFQVQFANPSVERYKNEQNPLLRFALCSLFSFANTKNVKRITFLLGNKKDWKRGTYTFCDGIYFISCFMLICLRCVRSFAAFPFP